MGTMLLLGVGRGSGGGYTLDIVTGAIAAYSSVRKLRSTYAGSAIRVRRSSDDTEADIGFVANALDTATLLAFAGAGNAFIVKWYDQTTNTKDFAQATASLQPKIVDTGAVLTGSNSKPVISHDGTDDTLATPNTLAITDSGELTIIYICKNTSGTSERFSMNVRSASSPIWVDRAAGANTYAFAGKTATFTTPSAFEIHAGRANGTSAQAYRNGGANILIGTFSGGAVTDVTAWTGSEAGSAEYGNVEIHELYIYGSALSDTELSVLGASMASTYGLTWTTLTTAGTPIGLLLSITYA